MNRLNRHETAFQTLDAIAKIEDPQERAKALRNACTEKPALTQVLIATYHPDYELGLPKGQLPEDIARKSRHDDPAPFYYNVRRIRSLCTDALPFKAKEASFAHIYESVSSYDADLLIGVKDKLLPWASLSKDFVVASIPEVFPKELVAETPTIEEVVDQVVNEDVNDILASFIEVKANSSGVDPKFVDDEKPTRKRKEKPKKRGRPALPPKRFRTEEVKVDKEEVVEEAKGDNA